MNPAYAQTQAVQTRDATTTMPLRRLIRAYLIEAKYESLRMLRAPAFGIPFLGLPAGLYLLFGVLLFGAAIAKDPQAGLYMFLGFSVFGAMGPGMFGFGVTVALERDQGMLKLKRALPMPPAASLIAKMLMSILFVTLVMATMCAAAPIAHAGLSQIQLLIVSVVLVLASPAFCAMGFLIGALASGKAAPAFVNLLYLPMIYLSGILLPLPKSMHWIELASPAYHLNQLARAAIWAPSEGLPVVHVTVLVGVTVVFTALAVRRLARVG